MAAASDGVRRGTLEATFAAGTRVWVPDVAKGWLSGAVKSVRGNTVTVKLDATDELVSGDALHHSVHSPRYMHARQVLTTIFHPGSMHESENVCIAMHAHP